MPKFIYKKKGGGLHSGGSYGLEHTGRIGEGNEKEMLKSQAKQETHILREQLRKTIDLKNIPDHVRTMGEKFLSGLKSAKGSTMPYTLLSDLVALSFSEWDDSSAENPEMTLEQIKNNHYPDWKPEDFKMLLGLIGEKDGDFKKMIEGFERERSE